MVSVILNALTMKLTFDRRAHGSATMQKLLNYRICVTRDAFRTAPIVCASRIDPTVSEAACFGLHDEDIAQPDGSTG
jgi:hypothetical protein